MDLYLVYHVDGENRFMRNVATYLSDYVTSNLVASGTKISSFNCARAVLPFVSDCTFACDLFSVKRRHDDL